MNWTIGPANLYSMESAADIGCLPLEVHTNCGNAYRMRIQFSQQN